MYNFVLVENKYGKRNWYIKIEEYNTEAIEKAVNLQNKRKESPALMRAKCQSVDTVNIIFQQKNF